MINELIDACDRVFGDLNEIIIESYVPSEGTYIIVELDKDGLLSETSRSEIKIDRKTKLINKDVNRFNLLCKLDYHSKLLDMNKSIDTKKVIHSNNYLSFFVKKESIGSGKLTSDIIENYYNALGNPLSKYEKKKNSRELYLAVENEIGPVNFKKLELAKEWIKRNLFYLDVDFQQKNYLKIFFLFDERDFEIESKRYIIPNIYNNNDFNIKVNDSILGMPNNNNGLNSKKTYLETKTRKIKVPYLINQEEAIKHKKLFDYLFNLSSQGYSNIYIGEKIIALKDSESLEEDFSGYYLRIKKGKEVELIDFDVVHGYKHKLHKPFEFINYLNTTNDIALNNNDFKYGEYLTLSELKNLINNVAFNGFLISYLYSEKLQASNNSIAKEIMLFRNKFIDWFYKGNDNNLYGILDKTLSELIKSNISNGYLVRAINQFNLKYSFRAYFNNDYKDLSSTLNYHMDMLTPKIDSKSLAKISGDNEYSFAIGQLANYFISRNKGKNKPMSLINPIINCCREKIIKSKLKLLFKKYSMTINLKRDVRFNNLYNMVMNYELTESLNQDLVIAGFLSSNLIYKKKENL